MPGQLATRKRPQIPVTTWVIVFAFCLLWIALGSLVGPSARKHDFLNLYTGASLALDGNFRHMHSPEVQLARERQFVPQLDALVPFVRLPFYALLLAPMALIPYAEAFWVWIGFQSGVLIACWIWAYRRWGPDALVFGALYLPAALGIAHGQDCVFMLVVVIVTYALSEDGDNFPSGIALGVGLIKFHLFLAWPLALLLAKRWRMTFAATAMIAAEMLLSILLAGAGGVQEYFALLRKKDIEHLNPSPELMINVHSVAINFGLDNIAIKGALVLLVVAMAGIACWRAPWWRSVAAVSTASLLIPPHVYGYDACLLLLGIWLAIFISTDKWTRIFATLVCCPLPYLMTLAGSPWAATTPIALLVFLACLAFRKSPTPTDAL